MHTIYRLPLLLVMIAISSCTPTPPTDSFCLAAYPVWLADDEHLDKTNADHVRDMDLFGEKYCGWN